MIPAAFIFASHFNFTGTGRQTFPSNSALLFSPIDLECFCSLWPQLSGAQGMSTRFAGPLLKGRCVDCPWATSCGWCIPAPQHPKTLAERRRWAPGDADWSPTCPMCFLMFQVGTSDSYKKVPKLCSKTAPLYSTHFPILLRSIQQNM